MLQNLREHVQGWIAGVIAGILCLAFALWGIEYYISNSSTKVTIAKVDGDLITNDQLETAYNRARQAQQMQIADPAMNEIFQKQLKDRVLHGLIQQIALRQAAEKAGYTISLAQVGASLKQIPSFQLDGQFSPELFQRTLFNLSYTTSVFLADMANSNLLQQAQHSLTESNFALPHDVNQNEVLMQQKRDFGYFLIPPDLFLSKLSLTEKEIQEYYKVNGRSFATPEQASLQYLLLSTEDIAKKVVLDEQELKQYYDNNKASFTVPKQWLVARILIKVSPTADQKTQDEKEKKMRSIQAQLKSKKVFGELAKKYSEDTGTAFKGGLIGWLNAVQQPELTQHISVLNPGEVAPPFKNKEGWNLLKLVAIKNPENLTFATAKPQIEKTLRQQKTDQLISKESDQLSNLTYTHPDTLQPAATALNLSIQVTPFFSREGEKTGFLSQQKILSAAFSDNVLKQHNNSDVISIDDHTIAVVRIADYKASSVKPLLQVKSEIEKILSQQAAAKSAAALGEKIRQNMQKGIAVQQLALQNKVKWIEKKDVDRFSKDKEIPAGLLDFVFNQPAPSAGKKVIQSKKLASGVYAIVALIKVSDGSIASKDVTQHELLAKQMSNQFGGLDADLYLAQRMGQVKIKMEKTTP